MSSSDEEIHIIKNKKLKKHHFEDRATSKFYTKDESQQNLPYVADNVFNIKKQNKTNSKKKSLHSDDQSSYEVYFYLVIIINNIIIIPIYYL